MFASKNKIAEVTGHWAPPIGIGGAQCPMPDAQCPMSNANFQGMVLLAAYTGTMWCDCIWNTLGRGIPPRPFPVRCPPRAQRPSCGVPTDRFCTLLHPNQCLHWASDGPTNLNKTSPKARLPVEPMQWKHIKRPRLSWTAARRHLQISPVLGSSLANSQPQFRVHI